MIEAESTHTKNWMIRRASIKSVSTMLAYVTTLFLHNLTLPAAPLLLLLRCITSPVNFCSSLLELAGIIEPHCSPLLEVTGIIEAP